MNEEKVISMTIKLKNGRCDLTIPTDEQEQKEFWHLLNMLQICETCGVGYHLQLREMKYGLICEDVHEHNAHATRTVLLEDHAVKNSHPRSVRY